MTDLARMVKLSVSDREGMVSHVASKVVSLLDLVDQFWASVTEFGGNMGSLVIDLGEQMAVSAKGLAAKLWASANDFSRPAEASEIDLAEAADSRFRNWTSPIGDDTVRVENTGDRRRVNHGQEAVRRLRLQIEVTLAVTLRRFFIQNKIKTHISHDEFLFYFFFHV